jgi:hypothetical protein
LRYDPCSLLDALLVDALVRRKYVVEAADVDRLRGQHIGRSATRLEALAAHVWWLLACGRGRLRCTRWRPPRLPDKKELGKGELVAGRARRRVWAAWPGDL